MSDLMNESEAPNAEASSEAKADAHTRRAFLFKISLLLNAGVGAVLAVPIVGFLLGPVRRSKESSGSWISLGNVDTFPVGETRFAEFVSPVANFSDGDTAKIPCWVRRASSAKFQVFAVNCAHLGCPVRWFPESRLFMCPCHGGAYYENGDRAAGPPDRGLFEYRTRIEDGQLSIHAGDMPTPATQASCKDKPLIQIAPATSTSRSNTWES
ncbi:Rieske (2Fe-2S) protein [Terriglobus sp. TAA 43]|uniref:QcrA and Rieske domain-containing protein n=1 Tax=Terriglobus sp. TAA 43 TaxID=278961 RepID=UPI000A04C007